MNKHLAVIALGSNLGDKLDQLQKACLFIKDIGIIKEYGEIYRSEAYGVSDQPDFLNTAILLETESAPAQLLKELKNIEKRVGRGVTFLWGPREIDLDIIFFDDIIHEQESLNIPHRDFHNRKFVLQPICDFAPEFKSPTHQKTIRELLNSCTDKTKLERISFEWDNDGLKI